MNYIKSLFPNSLPAAIDPADHLAKWQEKAIHILAMIGILAGIIISLLAAGKVFDALDIPALIASALFFVVSATIFFGRNFNLSLRSIMFLTMLYILFLFLFTRIGWSGESLLGLLAFSMIGSALLERRQALVIIGITTATLILCLAMASSNLISNVNIITQSSLLLDAALVLVTSFLCNFIILSIKTAYVLKNLELQNANSENREMVSKYEIRSVDLEHRLQQLRSASEISRSLASMVDPTILIQQVAEQLKTSFGLYYVGVFLVDPTHEYAILRYGTGDEGKNMLANRHRLAIGGYSMIGWTTQTRKARVALDVGEEAVHFDNPDLPSTRSELALPIKTTSDILGALSLQSDQQNAFSENDVILLQGIADSLAVALENATSFAKTQKALEDIRILNKAFVQQAWGDEINQVGELKFSYENPLVSASQDQTSIVQVPLVLRDETIGYFSLEIEGNDIQPDQREFIQTISAQTTSALENARLIEETQRAAAQEQKLNALSTQFSRAFGIEEILKTAVEEFGHLPSVTEASISLMPPEEFSTRKQRYGGSEVK